MSRQRDNNSNGSSLKGRPVFGDSSNPEQQQDIDYPQPLPAAAPSFDVLLMIRRSLRGRYGRALALTAAGLIIGGVTGWFVEKPEYKSEGLVRIAYSLTPVLKPTDQNQPMPMFESYMRSQQLRMGSQSLAEKSLEAMHPGQKITPAMIADFAQHLVIDHPNNGDNLRPSYTDSDPLVAATAVGAVINVFQEEYDKAEKASSLQRIEVLDLQRQDLEKTLTDNQNQANGAVYTSSSERRMAQDKLQLLADQVDAAEQLKRQYLKSEMDANERLEQLQAGGLLDSHPTIIELKSSAQRSHAMVQRFDAEILSLREQLNPDGSDDQLPVTNSTGNPTPSNPPTLSDDARKMHLDRLIDDSTMVRKQLAEVTERIQALKLEMGESRLDILSLGDIPIQPSRDRRKYFAWGGGALGAALPTALLVLLGLIRPRYRYSDETSIDLKGTSGLLGILPMLPSHLGDPERAAGAAQCVHQMRVMLQSAANGKTKQYLMTSACAGEGKTSLCLAMGLSFAASGTRTLVVDGDLVGRALTRGFGATNERGLYEALSTGDATPHIRQTTSGLWFLPAGRANALHASKVSGHAVRQFLDAARKEYDVVIIDSGPILGSVEAASFAPEVDGVIITVARGQAPALVEKTAQHLRSISAHVEGYVFNRAQPKDFYRSSYASSIRPMSSREMMVRVLSAESDGLLRFGPLVESVMSSLPATDAAEEEVEATAYESQVAAS